MSEELLYTSAPKGLKAGSRGFCTVQATAGMPPATATLMESLSGYRHVATPGDSANLIVWRHVIVTLAGQRRHVLSRLADAGADYTGRSNKLVHHIAFDAAELNTAGPAWSQLQAATHDSTWSGEPKVLRAGRSLTDAAIAPQPCSAWRRVTGDAGWGGFLAQRLLGGSSASISIVYSPQISPLELVAETIALLPERHRWRVTYTTCHTNLPPGVECAWRFVPDGSPEALELRKRPDIERLDLTGRLGPAPDGPWVAAARTGKRPEAPAAPPPPVAAAMSATSQREIVAAIEVDDPADWESDVVGTPSPPPRYRRRGERKPSFNGKERSMSAWALTSIATVLLILIIGVPAAWFLMWGPGKSIVVQYNKARQKAADTAEQKRKEQEAAKTQSEQAEETRVEVQQPAVEEGKYWASAKSTPDSAAYLILPALVPTLPPTDSVVVNYLASYQEGIRLEEMRLKRLTLPVLPQPAAYCNIGRDVGASIKIRLNDDNGIPDPKQVRFLVPSQWTADFVVKSSTGNTALYEKVGLEDKLSELVRVSTDRDSIKIKLLGLPKGYADVTQCAIAFKSEQGNRDSKVFLRTPGRLPQQIITRDVVSITNLQLIDLLESPIRIPASALPDVGLTPAVRVSVGGVPKSGDANFSIIKVGDVLTLRCVRESNGDVVLTYLLDNGKEGRSKTSGSLVALRKYVELAQSWNDSVQGDYVAAQKARLQTLQVDIDSAQTPIEKVAKAKSEQRDIQRNLKLFDRSFPEFCQFVVDARDPERVAERTYLNSQLNSAGSLPFRAEMEKIDSPRWAVYLRLHKLISEVRTNLEKLSGDFSIAYPLRQTDQGQGQIAVYAVFASTEHVPAADFVVEEK